MSIETWLAVIVVTEAIISAALMAWGWRKGKNILLLVNAFSRLYVATIFIWVLVSPGDVAVRVPVARMAFVTLFTTELLSWVYGLTIGKKK